MFTDNTRTGPLRVQGEWQGDGSRRRQPRRPRDGNSNTCMGMLQPPAAFENKQFGLQQKTYKNHKRSKHISKRRSENRQAIGAVKNSVTYIHKSDKDKRQQPNNNANNKSKP